MLFLTHIPSYWLWLALIVVFVVVEMNTSSLVSIWFVPGCIVALIAGFFTDSLLWQFFVFALVSAVSLLATRPLVRRSRTAKRPGTGAERNVGRIATVLTPLRPGTAGRVRLDGVDWFAASGQPLDPGAPCRVLQVRGTTLLVEPMPITPNVQPPQESAAQDKEETL